MRLLDAFALSNARADRHVASKTRLMVTEDGKRVTSAVMDCLHYCLPSAVDTWNVLLVKALLGAGGRETQGDAEEQTQRRRTARTPDAV